MLRTLTPVRFDEVIKVFFAVVVGNFVTGIDDADGFDKDAITDDYHLAVWFTGVIDVARDIFAVRAVDRFSISEFEEVLAGTFVGLFIGDQPSGVFQDSGATRNVSCRKYS